MRRVWACGMNFWLESAQVSRCICRIALSGHFSVRKIMQFRGFWTLQSVQGLLQKSRILTSTYDRHYIATATSAYRQKPHSQIPPPYHHIHILKIPLPSHAPLDPPSPPPLSQAQPRPLPLRQRHPTLRQNPQQPQRIRPRPAPTKRQVPPDEGNLPAVSLVEPHELGAFLGAVYKGRFGDGGRGEGLDVCCWCRREWRCCCGRGGV